MNKMKLLNTRIIENPDRITIPPAINTIIPGLIPFTPLFLNAEEQKLITLLLKVAEPYMKKQEDPAHDMAHVNAVLHYALEIAASVGGNRKAIIVAAILHDIINPPKNDPRAKEAATDSAKEAKIILRRKRFQELLTPQQIKLARTAISQHSFESLPAPTDLEAQIIRDADTLDKIGWRGILRTAAYAKHKERQLYHPTDPLAEFGRTPIAGSPNASRLTNQMDPA